MRPGFVASFAAACAVVAGAADAEPTREYVVRSGDTCMSIAIRELGDRTQLDELHRLNPQLGPLPHDLVAGQVLHLPLASRPRARTSLGASRTKASRPAPRVGAGAPRALKPAPDPTAPAAPRLTDSTRLALGWAGHGASLRSAWTAIDGADAYRVTLVQVGARGPAFAKIRVPASETSFAAAEVPPGDYELTVVTVEGDATSAAAASGTLHVAELALPAAAQTTSTDGGTSTAPPVMALGTVLTTPAGLRCGVDSAIDGEIVIEREGVDHVACWTDDDWRAIIDVTVPRLRFVPPAVAIARIGAPTAIAIELRGGSPPIGTYVATSPDPALVIDGVTRTATGAQIHVHGVHAAAVPVTLALATTGGPTIELGYFDVDVRPPAPEVIAAAAPTPAPTAPSRIRLAIVAGGIVDGYPGSHSDRVGITGELHVSRYVGADVAFLRPAATGMSTLELGGEARYAFRIDPPFALTPAVRFGFASRIANTSSIGVYVGGSLAIGLTPHISAIGMFDAIFDDYGSVLLATGGLQVRVPPR